MIERDDLVPYLLCISEEEFFECCDIYSYYVEKDRYIHLDPATRYDLFSKEDCIDGEMIDFQDTIIKKVDNEYEKTKKDKKINLKEIVQEQMDIKGQRPTNCKWSINKISHYSGQISADIEESWSHGGYDSYTYLVPIWCAILDNWKEVYQEQFLLQDLRKKEEDYRHLKIKEQKEYDLYLKLKAKFESDGLCKECKLKIVSVDVNTDILNLEIQEGINELAKNGRM